MPDELQKRIGKPIYTLSTLIHPSHIDLSDGRQRKIHGAALETHCEIAK